MKPHPEYKPCLDTEPLLHAKGLTRYHGRKLAVEGLNLHIHKGQILGLLGPNGAGKSTTLALLSGNLAPHAGTVLLQGQDLYQQPQILRRQLGYLPDRPPLYPELYVDEYLHYCADLHAMSANRRKEACAQVKQACGLEKHGRSLIGALSRGYQQRLGIAQALIHDPPLIIFDEPTVALDPIQLHEIRHLIQGLAARHAVIFSTHLLSEAQAICSHIAIINHGRLRLYTSLTLWQQAPEDQWEVAFRRPPTLTQLQQLLPEATIHLQERSGSVRFLIQTHQDPAARLVTQSVKEQWELYELTPHRLNLEQRFLELLEHDQEHAPS